MIVIVNYAHDLPQNASIQSINLAREMAFSFRGETGLQRWPFCPLLILVRGVDVKSSLKSDKRDRRCICFKSHQRRILEGGG